MKINWKIRFKNKTWLTTFFATLVTFVYQVLSMFEVVSPISQDTIIQLIGLILNVLVGLGVILDPTTKGLFDTEKKEGGNNGSK